MSRRKKIVSAADLHQAEQAKREKRVLRITPPEGVPIGLEQASLGSRFGAQSIDLLLTYGTLFALILLVLFNTRMSWPTASALFALLSFLLRIPYYILTELVWNGRTIGKRWVKIRVISVNGRRLDPHQVVVRNLMKEAEVFTPLGLVFGIGTSSGYVQWGMALWLLIVLAVPVFSKRKQRLGDMIAGTCVVQQPKAKLMAELTNMRAAPGLEFDFLPVHLEHYGKFELQSLEDILRDRSESQLSHKRDNKVAETIRKKIGYADRIPPGASRAFLSAFYNAQRAHLEGRQLLGDRREDKFHTQNGGEEGGRRAG